MSLDCVEANSSSDWLEIMSNRSFASTSTETSVESFAWIQWTHRESHPLLWCFVAKLQRTCGEDAHFRSVSEVVTITMTSSSRPSGKERIIWQEQSSLGRLAGQCNWGTACRVSERM